MYNPRHPILVLAVAGALLSGGCAREPRGAQVSPEPGQDGPAGSAAADPATQSPAQPWKPARLVKPEHDLRYKLPAGQKRALSIFIGSQTFEYVEDGEVFLSGRVSSGTADHPTPKGDYRVLNKDINKRSGKYTNGLDENTPMPYSLQFTGPYFVHEGWVPGYADSHGCVRLDYEDARLLFHRIRLGDPISVKAQGAARPANPWPDLFPIF